MKLPSIQVSLPLLLVLWLVGAHLAGMTALWAYPAMWFAVAALLHVVHMISGRQSTTDG